MAGCGNSFYQTFQQLSSLVFFSHHLYQLQNRLINIVMQFLKNLGATGVGAAKGAGTSAKPNYFASLKLQQQQKKPVPTKQKGRNKKANPPKGFVPEKYALDFSPPCIILQYRNPQNNKIYHHKMRIKKLKKDTSTNEALDYLKKKHYHFFIPKVIDQQQIQKLIQKLKNGLIGQNKSGIQSVNQVDDFDFDYDDDFDD